MRYLGLTNTRLSKGIKDLNELRDQLEKTQASTTRCLALRDFLLNEAKVVLLVEYDRTTRIININKTLIPDMKQEMTNLKTSIKFLEQEVAILKKRLAEVDKKLANFGKVIYINARRQQKASGI